jgi:hypothetical protein
LLARDGRKEKGPPKRAFQREIASSAVSPASSASKAFGELVEHVLQAPSLSADDVKSLIDAQADVVVLDAR